MVKQHSPDISIVLPYLSGSTCIEACLKFLKSISRSLYEVCSVIDVAGAYEANNQAAALAKGKVLV